MNGIKFNLMRTRRVLKFEIETGGRMNKTPGSQQVLAALDSVGMEVNNPFKDAVRSRIFLYMAFNEFLVANDFQDVPLDVDKVRDRLPHGERVIDDVMTAMAVSTF